MLVDNASEQHVQTNRQNTERQLEAALASEELLEAANNEYRYMINTSVLLVCGFEQFLGR